MSRRAGRLHLGHYFGTLHNRVRLQALGVELMVVVAGYQTITDRDSPASLAADVDALLADDLAVGILFCKATVVPVGKDQLPHLKLTRTIARRFNRRYSPASATFPEPAALLSDAPALLGTDGQKMSKSRANAIPIGATADETARLIAGAKTDAERRITFDPARRPEVSNLVLLAALCLDRRPHDVAGDIGDAGSAALKRLVTEAVNERFREIRARRTELAADPGHLRDVLHDGNRRARQVAEATLTDVKRLMHSDYAQPAGSRR